MSKKDDSVSKVTANIDEANMVLSLQLDKTVAHTAINLETLIDTMRATGASDKAIREVLLNDLNNGGRIFGQFKNQFKAIGEFGIGNMAMGCIGSILGGNKMLKWQAVGKNICPDCERRHGQVGTHEEWKLAGLPQSGFSVCGMHCKCTLVDTGKWQKDPLKIPLN